jgi:hypothetical protein
MSRRPPNHPRTRAARGCRVNIDMAKTYWLVVLRLVKGEIEARPYQKRVALNQAVAEIATHAKQAQKADPEGGKAEGILFKRRIDPAELTDLLGNPDGMKAVEKHPAFAMLLGQDDEKPGPTPDAPDAANDA